MKNLDTEQIWKEFNNQLKFFIIKNISDKDDANDILQEVFIKIHNKLDTLSDINNMRAWLYQIVRNSIVDYYRKRKINFEIKEDDFISEDETDNTPHKMIAKGLGKYIDNLPKKYYDALCLIECEGLNQKEMAEELGLSLPGAKSRVQRARQMIKDDLMKCCHFEFDKYGTIIDYHPITCCCCKQNSSSK